MAYVNWIENWEDYTVDPQDGKEPFDFWWEDMRKSEIKQSIQTAYERGMDVGKRSAKVSLEIENLNSDYNRLWVVVDCGGCSSGSCKTCVYSGKVVDVLQKKEELEKYWKANHGNQT